MIGHKETAFYITRLKNASLPEIMHRLMELWFLRKVKRGCFRSVGNRGGETIRFDSKFLKSPDFHCTTTREELAAFIEGKTFTLNTPKESISRFEETRRGSLFPNIPLDGNIDIRTVWEPARLQHVSVLLAHLSSVTGTEDAVELERKAKGIVLQWIGENPFLLGPHYMSAMECGLRIPVFACCLSRIQSLSAEEGRTILRAIYQHAWLISRRISLYSSLGNHTVAECVGLVFGGALFQDVREGKKWMQEGFELLEHELCHQILGDGGPAEQSLNYHRFVLDLYWLVIGFLECNELRDCEALKPRLRLGEEFLACFCVDGRYPAIGDSDDGHAIAPGIAPPRAAVPCIRGRVTRFGTAGYSIVTTGNGGRLIFDHGPLGMPPLYNHGHADALSLIVYKDGEEILVDPGTYRYNGEPEFRRYFKSTRGHNTVAVDGLDQAVQETSFVWTHPYHADLLESDESEGRIVLKAVHDGYERLNKPVTHTRTVILMDEANFLIKDTFVGDGRHHFELNFHFHPDVSIDQDGIWWRARRATAEIALASLHEARFRLVCGQDSPLLGWYSPAYGVKVKCPVLTCVKDGFSEKVSFVTVICTGPNRPDASTLERIAWQI